MVEQRQLWANNTAGRLSVDIVRGKHRPASALPPEIDLGNAFGANRLTLRETTCIPRAGLPLRAIPGRGMFVNLTSRWSVLNPRLLAARMANNHGSRPKMLLEARAIMDGTDK
jgi:DNA-binding FadR family transcriptional regulator